MEVLRDMWQLQLEIIRRFIPNPGAFKETLGMYYATGADSTVADGLREVRGV
jgi:hypothetical protein